MKNYDSTAYEASKLLTLRYSSSFGISSKLFSPQVRPHIYAIYALVRVADEIVDNPHDEHTNHLLNDLESETYHAISSGYSTNIIVHAFALTARLFDIEPDLIKPFFASMRMDLTPQTHTQESYSEYIHGSAEVIGLMCLKVFCEADDSLYRQLSDGAKNLGSAYQRVNFMRDIAADHNTLGRFYLPGLAYETITDIDKKTILTNAQEELVKAYTALRQLPRSSRVAVMTSYNIYQALIDKLDRASIKDIKNSRQRISDPIKLWLVIKTIAQEATRR